MIRLLETRKDKRAPRKGHAYNLGGAGLVVVACAFRNGVSNASLAGLLTELAFQSLRKAPQVFVHALAPYHHLLFVVATL
jgi:hypothetical protein